MLFLAEELSDDESFAMMAALLVSVFGAFRWLVPLHGVSPLYRSKPQRTLLWAAPLFGLAGLTVVLFTWSAVEVRTDVRYVGLFLLVACAWLTLLHEALPWLGLIPRGDVIEHGNTAAAVAIGGAQVGLLISFAAATMGEGPTIWTTIGPAMLAAGAFMAMWILLESATRISEAITVERDVASAARFAGLMVANGLVLGKAVAGDWESEEGTLRDFAAGGWPVLVLTAAAVAAQWALAPARGSVSTSVKLRGVVPAILLIAAAIVIIVAQAGDESEPSPIVEPSRRQPGGETGPERPRIEPE